MDRTDNWYKSDPSHKWQVNQSIDHDWGTLSFYEKGDYIVLEEHIDQNEPKKERFHYHKKLRFRKNDYAKGISELRKKGVCEIPVHDFKISPSQWKVYEDRIKLELSNGRIQVRDVVNGIGGIPTDTHWGLEDIITESYGSFHDKLDELLSKLGLSENEFIGIKKVLENEFICMKLLQLSLDKTGYTGSGVIKTSNAAIKIDIASRLKREYNFYQAVADSDFSDFCPSLTKGVDLTEFEGVGFLVMTNLDNELVPGFMKANKFGFLFQDYGINYNLFLMSLFHASAMGFNDKYKESLQLATYEDLNGNPHHKTVEDPGVNSGGEAYNRFKDTKINGGRFRQIIDNYHSLLDQLSDSHKLSIIDGDWKQENLYKGYKVDFSCVGYGLEIDDIAYYLSDARFNINFEGFKEKIGEYITLRMKHDDKGHVRIFNEEHIFMQLSSSAWLRQLVLRHSVMKKRDLMDDSKYKERMYYQQRIKEVLKSGSFL